MFVVMWYDHMYTQLLFKLEARKV